MSTTNIDSSNDDVGKPQNVLPAKSTNNSLSETTIRMRTRSNLIPTPYGQANALDTSKMYEPSGRIQIIIGDGGSLREEIPEGSRLENRLKMKDLETLKQAFDINQASDDDPLKLGKEDFVSFLSTHLNKGTEREYEELFDNIDATHSGFVDWDKMVSYMLLMFYESDDRVKAFSIPNFKPIKSITNKHRDSIKRIELIKNINRYITISKEGCCCLYDKNTNLSNSTKIHAESCKDKDLWITDFTVLQNVNKVVLALTTKEIAIYEMTTRLDFNCQYRITHLAATPLCLDYWFDPANPNDSILIWGDTNGEVHTIHFNSATIALFERPSTAAGSFQAAQQTSTDNCLLININEIKDNFKNAMYISYKAHKAWIRQVKWVKNLDCVLSCALTSKESVCLGWFVKKSSHIRINYSVPIRALEKSTFLNISNGGVNGFDYDTKMNLITTANQNGIVNLFNPYVCEQPNGILKGHLRAVLACKFMTSRSQLISFSADKLIRIWNVPLQICIHRIANVFPKGPEVESTCWFDEVGSRVFLTFRYSLLMLEIKPEIKDRVISHEKSVVCVKFNKITNQVVSLGQDGSLHVWQLESGQKIKHFNNLHGTADVTCMEFDEVNNRIYTGSADGTVKIWDYNGHNHHILELNNGQNCEISQVLPLKRKIIVVGWQKTISTFPDSTLRDLRVEPTNWKANPEHEEDILCAAVMKIPPAYLATASFDGDIVIWNSVTDMPFKHLLARKRSPIKKFNKENTSSSLRSDRIRKPLSRRLSKQENAGLNDPDNDFSCAITCLRFLNKRNVKKDAILISCGGNGWVRFWDVHNAKLVAEFTSHTLVSSVIMELNESETYLATGDVNGLVKIWNIANYCMDVDLNTKIMSDPPTLHKSIQVHNDAINSLEFVLKGTTNYILSASSDCSISLCDIDGNLVGIFGQENHWRLDGSVSPRMASNRISPRMNLMDNMDKNELDESKLNYLDVEPGSLDDNREFMENVETEQHELLLPKLKEKLVFEETFKYESDAFVNDTSLRYNPWSKTMLGRVYQETRSKKRERKQPDAGRAEDSHLWDKNNQVCSLYSSLLTVDLEEIKELPKKNDILGIGKTKKAMNQPDNRLKSNSKQAFDEKTLFPKYILEKEAKMIQEHKKLLEKINSNSKSISDRETSNITSITSSLRKKKTSLSLNS